MPFTQEQIVEFAKQLPAFSDNLTVTKIVNTTPVSAQKLSLLQRKTMDRPVPFIGVVYDGIDQTGNFNEYTQTSVPVVVDQYISFPFKFANTDRANTDAFGGVVKAALKGLASRVDTFLLNMLVAQAGIVIKRTTSASGYDDTIQAAALMDEIGIDETERNFLYTPLDLKTAAANLASRQNFAGQVEKSWKSGAVTDLMGEFAIRKSSRIPLLTAATATGCTINTVTQYTVPASQANNINVDSRYSTVIITVGGGTLKAGDVFTIAGNYDCNMITKQRLQSLKTYRVVEILSGGGNAGTNSVKITPPLISNQGNSFPEKCYQNSVNAPAATNAAIAFLNTATRSPAIFWQQDAIELLPSELTTTGSNLKQETMAIPGTKLFITMSEEQVIDDMVSKARLDIRFGAAMLAPNMCGLVLTSQT